VELIEKYVDISFIIVIIGTMPYVVNQKRGKYIYVFTRLRVIGILQKNNQARKENI